MAEARAEPGADRAAPRRDDRIGRRVAALEHLVPADGAATAGAEPVGDTAEEPGLQVLLVGDAPLGHELLRARVGAPAVLAHLVAADADDLVVEDLAELVEDGADEGEGLVLDVQHLVADAEARPRLAHAPRHLLGAADAELGVRGEDRARVPGDVELRHDADAPLRRVGDELAQLGLPVPALVRHPVERRCRAVAELRLGAAPAELGEPRVRPHLEAPALVV